MSTLLKNLVIALIVVILLGGGYYVITSFSDSSTGAGDVSVDVKLKTEKILADTQKINTYKLDVSIFADSRFTSLEDRRVQLVDVNTGRLNPFEVVK